MKVPQVMISIPILSFRAIAGEPGGGVICGEETSERTTARDFLALFCAAGVTEKEKENNR